MYSVFWVKPHNKTSNEIHLFNLLTFHVSKNKWHARGNLITFYNKKAEPTELKWKRRKYNIRDSQCTLFSGSTELPSLALPNIIL